MNIKYVDIIGLPSGEVYNIPKTARNKLIIEGVVIRKSHNITSNYSFFGYFYNDEDRGYILEFLSDIDLEEW